MLKEGVTIFVSTAYLDEAERCTRVGLMDRGRLVLCDTPQRLKSGLAGLLIEWEAAQPRAAREMLAQRLGADRASLFGGKLRLLAADDDERARADRALLETGMVVSPGQRIVPSLEDVFINQVSA
jgi:ABC-2 type transport system ATP-binding protein